MIRSATLYDEEHWLSNLGRHHGSGRVPMDDETIDNLVREAALPTEPRDISTVSGRFSHELRDELEDSLLDRVVRIRLLSS